MRPLLLVAIILGTLIPTKAQDIQVSLPEKFILRSANLEVMGKYNELNYVHVYDRREHQMYVYRDNMGLKWKKELPFDANRFEFEKLYFDRGQFTLFYSDRGQGNKVLFAETFSTDIEADTPIYTVDTIPGRFAKTYPEFAFLQSDSRAYTLVYYIETAFNQNDQIIFTLLNRKLEKVLTGSLHIPTTEKRTELYDILVDDSGVVYVVMAEFKDANLEHARRYWVMTSKNGFKDLEHYDIKPRPQTYLNNVKFKVDNFNKNLVIAGFYAEDYRKSAYAEGVYFQRIDLKGEDSSVVEYQKFPSDFIARIQGSRAGKTGRLYTFLVDQILLRQDGGAVVLTESFYKTYRRSPDIYDVYGMPMYSESSITYHFDELLVFSLHPKGDLHWKNILLKHQSSTGDYGRYSSYALMNTGDLLTFLFNDEINNRSNIVTYTVDVRGEMKRSVLLNSRKYDVYLLPQFAKQVSSTELVIPSIKRNELRMVKLTY